MPERLHAPAPAPAPAPPAPAPAKPKEGPAPVPEGPKQEEASELASIELTLSPINLEWPKGPGFFSAGVSGAMPFHVVQRPILSLDVGPSVGFDFQFGDTPVLPQTAGYTGTSVRGAVDVALGFNFRGGHKLSLKLAPGGGYTMSGHPELAGRFADVEGGIEYSYEARKGITLFGGFSGGFGWEWAQSNPSEAESGASIGFGAGITFGWPIGKKKQKTKEKVTPPPVLVKAPEATPAPAGPKTYSAADVPRPVMPVNAADEAQFVMLRDYVKKAAGEMRAAAGNPPRHAAWMKDNPNIESLLALVDDLVRELDARSLIVRFDLPAGQDTLGSYEPSVNEMHLPPVGNAVTAEMVASLIHEYVHAQQDRAVQTAMSAARGPLEHTAEDELQNEIDSYVTEHYFLALLQLTSLKEALEFGDLLKISRFTSSAEKIRTGNAAAAAEGRTSIRELVEPKKRDQIAENAPMRTYRLEIDAANRAKLITGADTSVDLGELPQVIDRAQLELAIKHAMRTHYLTELRAMFAAGYQVVTLRVYQGATELEQIELRVGNAR